MKNKRPISRKRKFISKFFQTFGMVLIAGVVVAVNIVAGHFSEIITIYLNGFGADFSKFDSASGNNICQEIESEAVVLLKNENNALPIKQTNSEGKLPVAVFGWGATNGGFITSGSGSGGSAERGAGKLVTFLGALEGQPASIKDGKEILPKVDGKFVYYHPLINMYTSYKGARDMGDYWNAAYPFFNLIEPSVELVQPHIEGAKAFASTAVVVISRAGGEGQDIPRIQVKYGQPTDYDRGYLHISKEEEDMLKLVRANFDKVVVIVNTCNAMELGFLDEKINVAGVEKPLADAAISVSGCGQSGAVAIANVLSGDVNPSGRLVDTFAYDLSTAATYANAPDCRTINGASGSVRQYTNSSGDQISQSYYIDYAEGIYNGYRWYETADEEGFWSSEFAHDKWGVSSYEEVVQYPFGYGLSYTTFTQEIISTNPNSSVTINENTDISVTVRVRNTGTVAGKDVVQLYYNPPYKNGGVEKSSANLVAFGKTKLLAPGEYDDLTLTFKASEMKSYDTNNLSGAVGDNGGFVLEDGTYKVSLRKNSHEITGSELEYLIADSVEIDSSETYNRFSGSGVINGDVAIDGSDTNEGIDYLTRKNSFESKFPTPKAPRARSNKMPANGWLSHEKDTTVMPTQGKGGSLSLYKEGNTLNEELVLELGADYNNSKWNQLMDQVSVEELYGVIQGAGFRTKDVPSAGKPEHLDLDGPSGLNQEVNAGSGASPTFWTSFPIETAIAQTWNEDISFRFGLTIGYEAYATGVAGWYGPAANIHRSPLDGRNFEYYSEDPYLSGKMCAKTINGAISNGLYGYVKHFVVNETENKREGLITWLNEQSLREIYAKGFEITVKEGKANAIMSGFNRIGATWCGGSYALLTGLLRDEWGFRGSIITDYALEWEMPYMDIAQGIRAGNDMWLNGLRTNTVGTIYDSGSATSISCAREATKNMLYTFCNTMYQQSEYLKNPIQNAPKAELVGKRYEAPPATWWWIVIGVDIAAVVGIGIWVFFCYFHKKKVKVAPIDGSATEVEPLEKVETDPVDKKE